MFLLYAAKKYILPGLAEICNNFLDNAMDPSNVCDILQQISFWMKRL